jgi:hypothetical protein
MTQGIISEIITDMINSFLTTNEYSIYMQLYTVNGVQWDSVSAIHRLQEGRWFG